MRNIIGNIIENHMINSMENHKVILWKTLKYSYDNFIEYP